MKTKILLITILSILFTMNTTTKAQPDNSKKILVAYFSWSPNGNTRVMAQIIQDRTGADIFEIVPVNDYPTDYNACVQQARTESQNNHRPAIKNNVENIGDYDIIFVGSPSWWSTVAPPVATFLSTHDLNGKTIIPFITHEGSRMGRSVDDIKKLSPGSEVKTGRPIRGGDVRKDSTRSDIDKWLQDNEIIK